MNLSNLQKITRRGKKRLGQGHGSGKVKTSGRGTKGQKARRKIPLDFEGGALPLIKRMPFLRGKGRNFSYQHKPEIINLHALNKFPKGTIIDIQFLISQKLVKKNHAQKHGVKVLGDGELTHGLIIKVPVSHQAKQKIEKVGGNVKIELNE